MNKNKKKQENKFFTYILVFFFIFLLNFALIKGIDMESWIKVNKTSGTGNDTVSITLEPNESSKDRTGTVDVATSTLNKILSITQKSQAMDVYVINVSDKGTGSISNVYKNSVLGDKTTIGEEIYIRMLRYQKESFLVYLKDNEITALCSTLKTESFITGERFLYAPTYFVLPHKLFVRIKLSILNSEFGTVAFIGQK